MSVSGIATCSAITVLTQFVEANGIRFAYRRWGKEGKLPLVFNQHFTGNLDNWDPAVLDGLAQERDLPESPSNQASTPRPIRRRNCLAGSTGC